ncbi:MAG TPA: hypothetical protein VNW04_21430 [Puia sp.]|jgi:hypothetical protein|nr:hypothetical protein [Puia sp.]
MTIKTICLVVGLGTGLAGRAQHLDYNRFELIKRGGSQSPAIDLQYDDIKGSAWFPPDWQPAVLISDDGRRYTDLRAKIDLYKNIAYIKINDTVYNINGTGITRIIFDPGQADSAVFQKGVSGSGLRPEQYLQVLATGKLGLLKQRIVELKDVHDEGPLSTTRTFVAQDYYYVVRPGGQIELVKPGRKLFEQEMGEKWKTVSGYAKTMGWSAGDESGWTGIMRYYNSLP